MLGNVDKFIGTAVVSAARAVAGFSSGSAQSGQRKRAHNDFADEEEEPSRGKRGKYQEPNIRNAAVRAQRALSITTRRDSKLSAGSLASLATSSKLRNEQQVILHPSPIDSEAYQLFIAMQEEE